MITTQLLGMWSSFSLWKCKFNINLYYCAFIPSHSANTTVTSSPNVISSDEAKAVVAKAAPPGPPKPIDPEGIYN